MREVTHEQDQETPVADGGGPAPAAGLERAFLQLQRSAGNRAVLGLLQREVRTRPKDLDRLTGAALPAALGRSSFGELRKALARYHKADDPQAKREHLQGVEAQAMQWLNRHAGSTSGLDQRRRAAVERLLDEVSAELVSGARAEAQDIYLENVRLAGERDVGSSDPRKAFALKALTGKSKMASDTPLEEKAAKYAEEKGLTRAEVAAIQSFTGQDYKYINPATAASKSWLGQQKQDSARLQHFADELLVEEGTLHTGVALQGLEKLETYTGKLYRGASYTRAEFKARFAVGTRFPFASLASGSKSRRVAEKFAFDTCKEHGKEIAVVSVLRDTGGRDIEPLSLVRGEREVALLPGSTFVVKSVREVWPPKKYERAEADDDGAPPDHWFVVELAPPDAEA